MGKFLKKNWFICVLVAALAGVSIYYIYETNKGKLKGKKDDGKDVIYEIDGTDTTADDFFTDLYRSSGPSALYSSFTRAVADQAYKTTDEMKQTAKTQASNIIESYAGQYGTSYKDEIGNTLINAGYENGFDDLEQYLIDYQKIQQLEVDYAKANFDDLKIRDISYILIQNKDPDASASSSSSSSDDDEDDGTRTDEEIEALKKKVDDSLAAGTSFADTAIAYSEDSSSAQYGGVLGVIDTNTESSLDADFFQAAMSLSEGEVSDWVHSDNFGWFKIKCDSASADTLADVYAEQQDFRTKVDKEAADEAAAASASPDASAEATASSEATATPSAEPTASATPTAAEQQEKENAPYLALASNYDNVIGSQSIWSKAEELGLEFSDDTYRTALRVAMGLDEEDDASATASPEASASAEASSSTEATASAEAN